MFISILEPTVFVGILLCKPFKKKFQTNLLTILYTPSFIVLTAFYFQTSIRHNLSLHSKFMRVQNEGTGKSSWWMVNPDSSKSGKSSRRRASNPDNGEPAHYNFLNEVPDLCSDRPLVIVPPPLYIIHLPDDIEFLLLTFPSMHVGCKVAQSHTARAFSDSTLF